MRLTIESKLETKIETKIELNVSYYIISGKIIDFRFRIWHNQFETSLFRSSRSKCQEFSFMSTWLTRPKRVTFDEVTLPQSLNFSFRSSNSCWAYSYNSISSEFIARILNQTFIRKNYTNEAARQAQLSVR